MYENWNKTYLGNGAGYRLAVAYIQLFPLLQKGRSAGAPRGYDGDAASRLTPPVITPASFSTDTVFGNGVDLQPSYYNGGNVTFGYSLMQQYPKIKSVRIEIEPTVDLALAVSWIHQAVSNGYKVIATYHKYTVLGSDLASDLNDAANWWKNNYGTLATGGPLPLTS